MSVGKKTGWLKLFLILLILAAFLAALKWWATPADSKLVESVQLFYKAGKHREVVAAVDRLISRKAATSEILLIAAKSSRELGQPDQAIDLLERIADNSGPNAFDARMLAAKIYALELHDPRSAKNQYLLAIQLAPDDPEPVREIARLLVITGHKYDARPFLFQLLQTDKLSLDELITLGNRAGNYQFEYADREISQSDSSDAGFRLVKAQRFARSENPLEAEPILMSLIESDSTDVEPRVWLGRIYWQLADTAKFTNWLQSLPAEADSHPDIWLLRGLWAKEYGQADAAIRCLWEAIIRDPDSLDANYQMSLVLGNDARADDFRQRFQHLRTVDETFIDLVGKGFARFFSDDDARLRDMVDALQGLGRNWEARAWLENVKRFNPAADWAQAKLSTLPELKAGTLRVLAEENPAVIHNLASYPLPVLPGGNLQRDSIVETSPQQIHFADQAAEARIEFQYENGGNPRQTIQFMYEVLGGGVAILDFNADQLPDIYLPQGRHWTDNDQQSEFVDRLFLNHGDGTFQDVTPLAFIKEGSFSQGVTVGDFDSDGFPDLYVANIGQNRLLRNNGDGTFSDFTEQANIASQRWTSSCVLADLSGDGLPDIYDVNYLSGEKLFDTLCPSAGVPRSCSPDVFQPEQDQFWLNQGDGTFQDSTAASGFMRESNNGNGLGAVAADFDRTGKLSLFVANDVTPNFFFQRDAVENGVPHFTEKGVDSGLAFDQNGLAQGSMGIAADDLNEDQRLDLFVTNFRREPNTLYLSNEIAYDDLTRPAGLFASSIAMVAFGTQFLDADLDSLLDIIVTNGNVADYRDQNELFSMPPQFYRNKGKLKFEELSAQTLGSYFQANYLGRGLAVLDWNQDGREDVAITHLDAPFALLTNQSSSTGNYLAVRLIGTDSCRDAIGATITIEAPNFKRSRQLTAGDGYESSNERLRLFGLGNRQTITRLSVEWPSGANQLFNNPPINRRITIVEGNDEAVIGAR